jgi:hypothetical protein
MMLTIWRSVKRDFRIGISLAPEVSFELPQGTTLG